MKKVLFVLPTITQTNGVAAFFINYISHMDLSKINIEVIYDDLRPSQKYEEVFKTLKINAYKIPYIQDVGYIKYNKIVRSFFKEHNDYDLVYSNVSYKSIIYIKAARKYGVEKFALHVHATQSSDNKIKNLIGNIIQKRINKMVDYKFACSNLAGKAIYKNDEYRVINNAIDYSKYEYNEEYRKKIRKQLEINDNEKIIGFVGRYVPQKNVFFFVDLIKRLPEQYKVLMIGNGAQKDLFVETIKKEKMENRFILIIETTNVNEYYSAFDYFILPSLFEGLPVVGVEAQANGLPCLFSNTISDECKISNNIMYINRQDIDEWITAVRKMRRKQCIELNNQFNIINQSKRFEQLINSLIQGGDISVG